MGERWGWERAFTGGAGTEPRLMHHMHRTETIRVRVGIGCTRISERAPAMFSLCVTMRVSARFARASFPVAMTVSMAATAPMERMGSAKRDILILISVHRRSSRIGVLGSWDRGIMICLRDMYSSTGAR